MCLGIVITVIVLKGKRQEMKWTVKKTKYFFTGIFLCLIHREEARYLQANIIGV